MSDPHEAIERRLRMLEKAFDTTQVGITVTDLDGRIVLTNQADARMHGYTPDELVGREARIFAPAAVAQPMNRESIEAMGSWRREAVNVRKDGSTFPVRLLSDVVCDDDGRPIGIVTCCENLTDRKQLEKRLLDQTFYHPITGLAKRGLLRTRIEAALARSRLSGRPFAILIVDVDRLKMVNEAFGRSAGDRLLHGVAARMEKVVEPEDMLAHLDGSEFGIQPLGMTRVKELEGIAARLREVFRAPLEVEGREVFVSLTMGAVIVDGEHGDADEVIRGAELALYRAKDRGLGLLEVYRPEMADVAGRRIELEGQLRHAWARGEFRVMYQPIVRLDSREVVGLEALLRWKHPTRGMLEADHFIPALEETGLLDEVGPWVLERACRDLRGMEAGKGRGRRTNLHVNVSPRQFAAGQLPDRLADVVRREHTAPERIQIEIVEGTVLPGHHTVMRQLDDLRSAGMRIGIDDFGTGYSSLGYLHRLPIDTVKIDRSFLQPSRETDAERLIRGIISLATGLGLEVITEGVEDEAWVPRLREMGCELGQGYLFGYPMEADGVAEMLA